MRLAATPGSGKLRRTGITRPTILVIIAASVWACSAREAGADVKINVSFDFVAEGPPLRDRRSTEYVLTSDHKVNVVSHMCAGCDTSNSHDLGQPKLARTYTGLEGVSRLRIDNGVIVHAFFTESYTSLTRIATNGVDSCTATKEYKLLQGHDRYEVNSINGKHFTSHSDIHAENVSCSIEEIRK